MEPSALEQEASAPATHHPNPPRSSRPPSSAGSTIDDPDMTDDDGKIDGDSGYARSQNLEAASPAAGASNSGSPQPTMDKLVFKRHSFESPSGQSTEIRARSSSAKKPRKSKNGTSSKGTFSWVQEGPTNGDNGSAAEEDTIKAEKPSRRGSDIDAKNAAAGAATVVGTRRQANGTIGSVYSGNKIRHLKKDDGVPLWRKDIQYEFLRTVFDDEHPVFTRASDGQEGCFFADIYIDAMARSSKTSKILKDKLQQDRAAAKNMAMICLLVNVGRMNTTLNFFPEMRAQLRTYHSIPSLQARADANAYKQLQDAPRLKSILKGASEDTDEPRTVEAIKEKPIPRTNPVNLIFVLSQYAPKISEIHFFPPQDFFDLVMRHTISSKSRARAFLWLMWWYLQSDFSKDAALNNPFGPGILGDTTDEMPLKVPEFEHLTEEQGDLENVDTEEEVAFGKEKQNERKRILEEDEPTQDKQIKKLKKTAGDTATEYDSSPALKATNMEDRIPANRLSAILDPATSKLGGQADSLEDDWEPVNPHPGRGRYKRPTKKEREAQEGQRTSLSGRPLHRTAKAQADRDTPSEAAATPQPPGSSAHPVLQQYSGENNATPTAAGAGTTARRPRPLTQHQLAVEAHRRSRVEYILELRKRDMMAEFEARRESQNWLLRASRRIEQLPDGYDSEDDDSWGGGGLVPNPNSGEEEDYGEEAEMWVRVLRRVKRRLERWSGDSDPSATKKTKRTAESRTNGSMPSISPLAPRRMPTAVRAGTGKASHLAAPGRMNGEVASSQADESEDMGQEADEGDADGEDVTMMLEEELDRPSKQEDEGLDDIDRALLADGDSDEGEVGDADESGTESDGGQGSDVDMGP